MKNLEITNTTFITALTKFKARLHTQGASEDQQYIKTNMAKEFVHYMEQNGKTKLDQINQKLVNNYFDYLMTRPLQTKEGYMSEGYLNKHREIVLRFIEFVQEKKKGQSGIRIKHYKNTNIPKAILLEDEVKSMFD